jgi:ribosomal protein L6P/L9E
MKFRFSRDDSRLARERHGLCRTLVANMVEGVSNGFQRRWKFRELATGPRFKAAI